jgi:hypothetical protein
MLLFGFKSEAALDVWSLEHFANGIAMAAAAKMVVKKYFKYKKIEQSIEELRPSLEKLFTFILVFVFALFWENVEHYVEGGVLPGYVGSLITNWFAGVEHWSNRLVADNLMVMAGWYLYNSSQKKDSPDRLLKKQNTLFWAARIFSTAWMLVHIFIFPDSMYLHRLLAGM